MVMDRLMDGLGKLDCDCDGDGDGDDACRWTLIDMTF